MGQHLLMGHPLAEWAVSLAIAVAAFAAGKLLYWCTTTVLRRWVKRSKSRLDDIILDTLGGPVVVMVTLIGLYIAFTRMGFTGKVEAIGTDAFHAAWTLSITWLVARSIAGILREYLLPYARERAPGSMDDNVMSLSVRAASLLIWGMGLIAALNNVGYDVSALLAGIGISGLALAMAAKDTVANVFGGITVFADRPFRVGDRIRIEGYDGTVIHVGIRSTRIRTIEGPLVVIPNFKFTDSVLVNVSEEHARRIRHDLGLVYGTTPAQLEQALGILRTIVQGHQTELEPEHTASFDAFKDWALNVVFIYHIRKGQDIEAVRTRVNLEVLQRFNAAGLEFAFPTQTSITKQG